MEYKHKQVALSEAKAERQAPTIAVLSQQQSLCKETLSRDIILY